MLSEKRCNNAKYLFRAANHASRVNAKDRTSFLHPRPRLFYVSFTSILVESSVRPNLRLSSTFRRTREIERRISNDAGNVNIPRRKVEISPAEFDDPTPRL
jgi:hypothetical protein